TRGYVEEIQDFMECVAFGRELRADLALACETAKLLYAGHRSAEGGAPHRAVSRSAAAAEPRLTAQRRIVYEYGSNPLPSNRGGVRASESYFAPADRGIGRIFDLPGTGGAASADAGFRHRGQRRETLAAA